MRGSQTKKDSSYGLVVKSSLVIVSACPLAACPARGQGARDRGIVVI
jgi:hypothetical protein